MGSTMKAAGSSGKKKQSKDPLIKLIGEMAKDKKLPMELLVGILEESITKAYKYSHPYDNVETYYDEENDEFLINKILEVVDDVEDDSVEISISDANDLITAELQKDKPLRTLRSVNGENIDKDTVAGEGDMLRMAVSLTSLGRIAIQNLKQTMSSKMLEAENNLIIEEYEDKIDTIIKGTIQRIQKNMVYVNIGRAEALMARQDQNPVERYYPGMEYNFAIKEIKITNKGPQVYVSRTDAKLIRLLFRREVPEIASGEVEIKAVAREAGSRTKISVRSENPDIDPVGACVGPRGMRLDNIIDELSGEKIDVVEWSDNPAMLISNALSPARVMRVEIYEDEIPAEKTKDGKAKIQKCALVVVGDDQLSLAIGKEGQNARLAAKLTAWKIDILNEEKYMRELEEDEYEYEEDEESEYDEVEE